MSVSTAYDMSDDRNTEKLHNSLVVILLCRLEAVVRRVVIKNLASVL
jgi:hypothetical protein